MHVNDLMLLEFDMFGMVVTIICLSCIPEGSGKASALGTRELVTGLRRDGYVRYGIVRYSEW